MNFAQLGRIPVVESAGGSLVSLDLDCLRGELKESFRRCGILEEWMGDSLLEVLGKKLRENREEGLEMTRREVEEALLGALEATGFSDVAAVFRGRHPRSSGGFPCQLQEWTRGGLESFLENCGEVPPKYCQEVLQRLPEGLSGAGYPLVSEALVLEYARHLVHLFRVREGLSPVLALGAKVRYISAGEWSLPLSVAAEELLGRRVLWLQPVSDILPVAVVQCRLARLTGQAGVVGEAAFLSSLPGLVAVLQECLVLMRGQMVRLWPEVAGESRSVVRFVDFPELLPLLSASRGRRERKELGVRLEAALRESFRQAPFPVLVRFQ